MGSSLEHISLCLGRLPPQSLVLGPPVAPAVAGGAPREGHSGPLWPCGVHVFGGRACHAGGRLPCPFSSKTRRRVSRCRRRALLTGCGFQSLLRLPEQREAGISPRLLTWAAGLKAEAIGRKKSCVAVKQVASLPFPFSSSVMSDRASTTWRLPTPPGWYRLPPTLQLAF